MRVAIRFPEVLEDRLGHANLPIDPLHEKARKADR